MGFDTLPEEEIASEDAEDIKETNEGEEMEKRNELRFRLLELQREESKCCSDKEELVIDINDLKKEFKNELESGIDKEETIRMQEQIIKLYENYGALVEKEADIGHKISMVVFQKQQVQQRQIMEKEYGVKIGVSEDKLESLKGIKE